MTIIAPTSQQRKTRLSKPSGRPLAKGLLASTDEAGQPLSSVNLMPPDPCAELLSPIPPHLAPTPCLHCQASSRLVAMRETYRSGWVAPRQVGRLSLCPRYRTACIYVGEVCANVCASLCVNTALIRVFLRARVPLWVGVHLCLCLGVCVCACTAHACLCLSVHE